MTTSKDINGHVIVGHGPRKVMVLTGWLGTSADWDALHPAIDVDAYTCAFFDFRGYGRSIDIAGDCTFAEAADDVLRLADALHWERFSLVGHSMGGKAAQQVLLAAPQRVEKLIAVSGVPASGSRMPPDRLANFISAVSDVSRRQAIVNFSTGNRLPAPWTAHVARLSWERSRPEAVERYLVEWTGKEIEGPVRALGPKLPVHLIVGAHDPTLGAAAMEKTWLPLYPQATIAVLPDAGHYAMLESPMSLAAAMQAFLGAP